MRATAFPAYRPLEHDRARGACLADLATVSSLTDSSFQLSFLAAGVIAGLAIPSIDRTSAPYRTGLDHLGDVTRDTAHAPRVAQFRIELRALAAWLARQRPTWLASRMEPILAAPLRVGLRLWEIALLSLVICNSACCR